MKNNTLIYAGISVLSLASTAQAGDFLGNLIEPGSPAPAGSSLLDSNPFAFSDKVKIKGDIRARYEFREQDGLDASHSLTTRARLGLEVGDFNGFTAFAEGEFTGAIIDDFNAGGGADPSNPGNTQIADPNNAEVNRAWIQYKQNGVLAKIGRQRIIRNNAAFIGNVGWRQNEQTYDAIQAGYSKDNFSIHYVYSDRVNRIFGANADVAPAEAFEGDFHFLDLNYKADFGEVGAYAYLIDVENQAQVGRSNTFGGFIKSNGLHAEVAYQEGNSAGVDYTSVYGHLNYTQKFGKGSLTAGAEYFTEEFKTPVATVHAFNGWADAFIGNRIGLADFEGIADFYLKYSQKLPAGFTFKLHGHYFLDDSLSNAYGYEVDALLVKSFKPNLKGLVKAGFFFGDDDFGRPDIQQVTAELNYSF